MDKPLSWKKPQRIFVCGMTDLFHDDVPDRTIQKIFETMRKASQHEFLFTTMRSERLKQMDDDGLLEWSENIWAGVTVENQKRRYRIDYLLGTGAKLKYLLVEPLLEEVDLAPWLEKIDWVVLGGESGRNARKMEADLVGKVRDDCVRENVPFYFKQWGGNRRKKAGNELDGRTWYEYPAE